MFPKLEGDIANRMKFRGKECIVWSLNNYLGLANHPEVRKADADAAEQYGLAAPMGARMMSGNTTFHEQLEDELSSFMGKENTLLMNYGYQGMFSVIDSLVNRNDVIVYDSESHACIVDGARLHPGKRFVFQHNDMESLKKQLERATAIVEKTGGGVLVITEGVFGMAGDQGKVKEIIEMKKQFEFRLLLDDAHGFGTMGKTGAGTGEAQSVMNEIDLYFGTFAKSMALIGAFISGKEDVIEYLRYNLRSQIFAKSLPLPIVIGALKRIELIRKHPEFIQRLWDVVRRLQTGLRGKGFNLGNTESPVTPVFLSGGTTESGNLVIDLRENYNIFCSVVLYPVVPKDVIMLRLIPSAAHTDEDVDYTVDVFAKVKSKLVSGEYASKALEVA